MTQPTPSPRRPGRVRACIGAAQGQYRKIIALLPQPEPENPVALERDGVVWRAIQRTGMGC